MPPINSQMERVSQKDVVFYSINSISSLPPTPSTIPPTLRAGHSNVFAKVLTKFSVTASSNAYVCMHMECEVETSVQLQSNYLIIVLSIGAHSFAMTGILMKIELIFLTRAILRKVKQFGRKSKN
jgi:hypothetical protein